ncbi:MAG: EAL domain-containing protein, partial [Thiotrichaceae bacterium]|nr:EAL domain-containing protein [Thiotrichaceae bacterium]
DELLRQISTIFTTIIRDSDTLARLGGDEFGIILNNCDMQHGELIANNILSALYEFRFLWEDNSFEIGASIGLVEITSHGDSTVGLLGHADIACYAAKDAGRNQLKVYQQDHVISKRKDEMQWASIIPTALAENKFTLYAQLIKPLNTDISSHSHYEILIRLKQDKGTIVPPGAFIPAAERYGLMNSIDLWVINQSLQKIGAFNNLFPDTPLKIAINLSGQSIGNKQLVEYITTLFEKYAIDASHITFEITETSAITNLSTAIKFIKKLKILGCKFALDDFGSGLSSFAYLKNLPVDFLKIDGAFIKDILDDPIDEAMVQSISQIGHVMNIRTIAEFVENSAIEQRLSQMNVDFVQGYGIEKPRPLDDIIQDARERASSDIPK